VRVPVKLDNESGGKWTPVPVQSGQLSERNDAGVGLGTPGWPFKSCGRYLAGAPIPRPVCEAMYPTDGHSIVLGAILLASFVNCPRPRNSNSPLIINTLSEDMDSNRSGICIRWDNSSTELDGCDLPVLVIEDLLLDPEMDRVQLCHRLVAAGKNSRS